MKCSSEDDSQAHFGKERLTAWTATRIVLSFQRSDASTSV